GYSASRARICGTASDSPSGCQEVYGESHHSHLRGHPEVRTKAEGTPRKRPSPWIEKKISEINIPSAYQRQGKSTTEVARTGRERNGRAGPVTHRGESRTRVEGPPAAWVVRAYQEDPMTLCKYPAAWAFLAALLALPAGAKTARNEPAHLKAARLLVERVK